MNLKIDYKFNIFNHARVEYEEQLTQSYKFITSDMAIGHTLTLDYLCIIADLLTGYNEMSCLGYFSHMRHFQY